MSAGHGRPAAGHDPGHLTASNHEAGQLLGLVLVAVGALALLCTRAAMAVDPVASPLPRNLFVRLDAGAALVVAAVTWRMVERARRTAIDGSGSSAPLRRLALRDLATLWGLWWVTVGLSAVMVHRIELPDALATAVTFRPHGTAALGLAVGRVVLALAAAIVIGAVAVGLERHGRTLWGLVGLLAVAGWVSRVAEPELDGLARAVVSLAASADHLALGLAVAQLARPRAGRSTPPSRRWAPWAGAAAALLLGLALAALAVDPVARAAAGSHDLGLWRAVAGTLVAGALLVAAATSGSAPWSRRRWVERSLAVAAPGLLLVHELAFVVVVRRYPERLVEDASGVWLAANASPALVWATLIAGTFGVLGTWVAGALRSRHDLRPFLASPLTVAALTAFAFTVRLVTLLNVAPQRTDGGDPRFYHVTANLVAHARGFPEPLNWLNDETFRASALHGPLYPLLLSISSRFGGTEYVDHKLFSLVIGAGVVLVAVLLARQVAGPGVAVVAGLLAALYPNLWILDSILFPEPLAALLSTLAVLAAFRWRAAPSFRASALLGVVIALGALARGEGVLLLGLLVAPCMLLFRPMAMRRRFEHCVLVGVAFLLVISPWTIRNVRVFEHFVPLSTNSNELLVYANCDTTYRGEYLGHWDFYCQERIRDVQGEFLGDESETALEWRRVALEYARDHVDQLPKVLAARVLRQWELYAPRQNIEFGDAEGRDVTSAKVALAMYYPLMALAVVGAVAHRRARGWLLPLLVPFAGVTFVALYAYGNTRFRAPAEPVLCVLAAMGLAVLAARMRDRRAGREQVARG